MTAAVQAASALSTDPSLSLFQLLEHDVLANPYPLYHRLRTTDPVHWDAFLHTWVVTRYADVVAVLQSCSSARAPTAEHLSAIGLSALAPVGDVMVRQMLFLDPPDHTRIRSLSSKAFAPRRVEALRSHIQGVADSLIDAVERSGRMDVIADLAYPLPAIVMAEILGVPESDGEQLKRWTEDFAGILGNFQHNPDSVPHVVRSVGEMTVYFRDALEKKRVVPGDDLISAFIGAELDGDRLSADEIIANLILVMVAGRETTTNLIGNGVLALLRHPDQLARLRKTPSLIGPAIEELMRFESPSQHTARVAAEDVEIGGRVISRGQAIMVSVGAANRDPERFPDPDCLDLTRENNRHVAFGWGSHFCLGAALARMEAQIAIGTLLRRFTTFELEPVPLRWRSNMGLRGVERLPVILLSPH